MKRSVATLKERLEDWVSFDYAQFEIGVCLGFWGDFGAPNGEDHWLGTKHIFWSENPLGDTLYKLLDGLVEEGMLEEENYRFRWNPNYSGSWE